MKPSEGAPSIVPPGSSPCPDEEPVCPGILGLLQPILKGGVHHITLPAQVIGRLGQDSVHQGLLAPGSCSLLVSLLHVGVGEVLPVFQTHGAETGPRHSFIAYLDLAWGCGERDQ